MTVNVRYTPQMGGALADGIADDTAAILRVLNMLKSRGGGELYFPEGVYLTDAINLQGPGGGNWANIRLTGTTRRSATSGGSIIRARSVQPYLLRAAGQNITAHDLTFDGDRKTTDAVVLFDYQSFGSGLERCFVTRTSEPDRIVVAPDHTSDSFAAAAHGFVDGDQVIFQTTVGLPAEIFQPAEHGTAPQAKGAYNWVWYIVNASPDAFQIAISAGGTPWSFSTNGSGVITAQKVGASLVRIGGISGLQADTGHLWDCAFIQDITDFSRMAGRAVFISDANAVLWDIQKCHLQGFIDGFWIRGGGASIRECTVFGQSAVSRSHLVKDGQTSVVHISDETYTEVDAVAWLVTLGSQAADYNQPWVFDFPFLNVGRGNINWDCRQPLQLRGGLGGDVHVRPDGNQYVTAFGVNFPLVGDTTPTFKGDLRKVIRIGQTDRLLRVVTEMQRLAGASPDPLDNALAGHGLFLSGGESADITVKKAGPLVSDLGEARVVYGNQSAFHSYAFRQQTAIAVSGITGNVFATAAPHGLTAFDSVRFFTTGTMPGNLSTAVDYWVVPVDATHFSVSVSQSDTVVTLGGGESGTLTAKPLKNFLSVTFDLANLPGMANASRIDSVGPFYISATGTLKLVAGGGGDVELVAADDIFLHTIGGTGNVTAGGTLDVDFDDSGKIDIRLAANDNQGFAAFNTNITTYTRAGGAGYMNVDTSAGATAGDWSWWTAPNGAAAGAVTLTERMRLKQAGGLTVMAVLDSNPTYTSILSSVLHSAANVDLSIRGPSDGSVTKGTRIQAGNGAAWQTVFRAQNQSGGNCAGFILENGGALRVFDAAAGATKQAVTGSRGGNAALASLLTALAAYGLITDSSTV